MPVVPLIQPSPPDLAKFCAEVADVWDAQQFTNGGPKVQKLEERVADCLGLTNAFAYSSCTAALVSLFKAMNLSGEVITTPFTFIATFNAIILAGLRPVLVDVEKGSLNLDPTKVEAAIGPDTCAVMPVHVYGNPCDLDAFDDISERYGLPIIYDAAQAFGVKIDGVSILKRGTASVVSTHATKVFSTVEGGFICDVSSELEEKIAEYRNFGLSSASSLSSIGTNAKMSELHAAFGLVGLQDIDQVIERRKVAFLEYGRQIKKHFPDGVVDCYSYSWDCTPNYNYLPVFVCQKEVDLDVVVKDLALKNIGSKRYFSPLVHEFDGIQGADFGCVGSLNNAQKAAGSVLCLPMFDGITRQQIEFVIESLLEVL